VAHLYFLLPPPRRFERRGVTRVRGGGERDHLHGLPVAHLYFLPPPPRRFER
jgi:hypothetical protein